MSEDVLPDILSASSSSAPQRPPISPRASIVTMPLPGQHPRRTRSQSISDFPPPMRRVSTDMAGLSRPVSFSAKFHKVHPATTGVTVLEHMERLDAVEAGLKRLGVDDTVVEDEEEEVDVGESSQSQSQPPSQPPSQPQSLGRTLPIPMSAPPGQQSFFGTPPPLERHHSGDEGAGSGSGPEMLSASARPDRLSAVPEDAMSLAMSYTEEDLAGLSKSMSHMDTRHSTFHSRFASHQEEVHGEEEDPALDWMQNDPPESPRVRTVISEVRSVYHPQTV